MRLITHRASSRFSSARTARLSPPSGGGTWQSWDIASGRPLEAAAIRLNGEVIRQSADASRYLTRQEGQSGVTMEITDLRQNTRQTLDIPARPGQPLQQIIPSEDWNDFIAIYSAAETQYPTGNDLAVYSFGEGLRFYVAGDDLPADSYEYGWLDERTIYAAGSQYGGQPERIYGIEYDGKRAAGLSGGGFPG